MPLIRKVIQVGRAKAVTLPRGWLAYLKETYGKEPEIVLIEIDGELKIKPKIS